MIPPPRAMASTLTVDPIVNDIQDETLRTAVPTGFDTRFGVRFRFPACHESAARALHAAPVPDTHASTPGESPSPALGSIRGGASEGAVRAATHPPHLPAWSMP